jgi:hypothetical protein
VRAADVLRRCRARALRGDVAKQHPELAGYARRLIAILEPRADADEKKLADELVDLLGDMSLAECEQSAGTTKCRAVVTALRDISLGAIDGDFLRSECETSC